MIREELPWFVKCDPQFQRICSLSELRVSNKVRDGVGIEGEGNGWRMVQRQKWVLKLAASAIYQSMVNNFHSTVDFPDGISKGNCRCSWLANSKKTRNERKKCRNPWWTKRENSKWDAWYRESGFLSYSATAYRRFSTISRRFNCFNRRKGLSSTISRSLNTFLYLWWTRGKNPDGRKKERKKEIHSNDARWDWNKTDPRRLMLSPAMKLPAFPRFLYFVSEKTIEVSTNEKMEECIVASRFGPLHFTSRTYSFYWKLTGRKPREGEGSPTWRDGCAPLIRLNTY